MFETLNVKSFTNNTMFQDGAATPKSQACAAIEPSRGSLGTAGDQTVSKAWRQAIFTEPYPQYAFMITTGKLPPNRLRP